MLLASLLLTQLLADSVAARPAASPDSQHVARAAREAQARFERHRRWSLPLEPGGAGGERCEEIIGRMCWWTPRDDERERPPEPPRIARAREALLAALDSGAALLPGDGWIAGQRVRYLVEAGRPAEAIEAAGACRADAWWCAMLTGLALHAAGDHEHAEAAFDDALRAMPEPERCRAADVGLLLERYAAAPYRRLDCAARREVEARLWWLADPLYSLPGNDRRTEHFARVAMARVQSDAATTFGLRWGQDFHEILVRYGWPSHWTQEPSTPGRMSGPRIIGREPSPSYRFLPPPHVLERPEGATPGEWELDPPGARERYTPRHVRLITSLRYQAALFRRGDSTLVIAAYDLHDAPGDSLGASQALEAALVLARDEHTPPVMARRAEGRVREVLAATAPWHPTIVGLEVLARAPGRAARARFGTPSSGPRDARIALSDLLLFDPERLTPGVLTPGEALPVSLPTVVTAAHGSNRVRAARPLGLYWEIYGLDPDGEAVDVSLAVTPARPRAIRRAAESLRMAKPARPFRLHWRDAARPGHPISSRALSLDLSHLRRGRHRLELSVRATGGTLVTVVREIEVVEN